MSWSIQWTDAALRDLRRLDRSVAQRVVGKLDAAAKHPERYFERLARSNDYKRRVGDYRLLALLAPNEHTLVVLRADHRRRVYDRSR
jgi:mRNA-degrading endonuclease RelE of RelBE toxin-antitoxin system